MHMVVPVIRGGGLFRTEMSVGMNKSGYQVHFFSFFFLTNELAIGDFQYY